jgi:signal transduction histidine kinase
VACLGVIGLTLPVAWRRPRPLTAAAEAVRYERSRIAADLHDIVGHALSLMVIQASASQRVALARGGNGGSGEASARTALEALTNALKHAPGAPVTVDIRARRQTAAGGSTRACRPGNCLMRSNGRDHRI